MENMDFTKRFFRNTKNKNYKHQPKKRDQSILLILMIGDKIYNEDFSEFYRITKYSECPIFLINSKLVNSLRFWFA